MFFVSDISSDDCILKEVTTDLVRCLLYACCKIASMAFTNQSSVCWCLIYSCVASTKYASTKGGRTRKSGSYLGKFLKKI